LLHDSKLDRTTGGSGPINQITTEVVCQLSAGVNFGQPYAGVRLPTLDEFMGAFAGKTDFYFDAKAIPPAALAEALERHDMVERTVVYQSAQYLADLKAINSKIRALPPLGKPEDFAAVVRLKPYGVDASWDILSPELIAQCHAAGIKVFSDALGDHERVEDYLQAIRWGIDVIQTDHPLRVFRAIELHVAEKPAATLEKRKPRVDAD
jgi:glycerophosphoryl diester phosphodiesterase